jgi:hypothetical protein
MTVFPVGNAAGRAQARRAVEEITEDDIEAGLNDADLH